MYSKHLVAPGPTGQQSDCPWGCCCWCEEHPDADLRHPRFLWEASLQLLLPDAQSPGVLVRTEHREWRVWASVLPGWAASHQHPLSPPRPFLSYQRMYYVFLHMLSSGPAWLGITLLVTVSLLPDVLKKVLCRQLWPTATEKTQVWRLPSLASHFPLSVL